MSNLLYDLHLGRDQRWRIHGFILGSPSLIISRRSWLSRDKAAQALKCLLDLLKRVVE